MNLSLYFEEHTYRSNKGGVIIRNEQKKEEVVCLSKNVSFLKLKFY